jgi:tetratricopeptide (TPR) repeat protein
VNLMRNQEGLSGELGTLVNTALKMIELRDWGAAIKALNKAIELSPDNPLLYVYRATAFNLNGDYVSAEKDARKAIELDPDNSPAYEALSWSLLRQEKYDEAIQAANRAIELDPQSAMPWAIRAYSKQMLGDLTGMLEDIKQAAALDSRFKPQYEAALRGGKIYDPSVKDELYILGPAKGRGAGGGAGSAGALVFLLLLLAGAGSAGAVVYRKRAKKAAAEGKKLDLNFLLKGGESKPLAKK